MLITEVQNLMLTITFAKAKIINLTFLDYADSKYIQNEQLTDISVTSLMEVSSIYICLKIFPAEHNHGVLQFSDSILAECDGGMTLDSTN